MDLSPPQKTCPILSYHRSVDSATRCDECFGGKASAAPPVAGRELDPLFEAVVDATEESVLNSMLMAPTVVGRQGNTLYGLDASVVQGLLQ